ncbi:formate dehydrogenase [Leeia sp. TBRC 13508]|uniref:Formate dehydrogenase n=1 Tax=Leeia speluncae TaxID=2884804 RepID=A0ABS8D7Q2_9NEIS|nr:formate dehydrogenase beta subunit [Leeia speluncae]MCB6184191.1 formate dehydrogenase [Leeia speluncae]
MSVIRVYVPCDSIARGVGADDVASAIIATAKARGDNVEVIRNSSRGMFWLEPLVEVATDAGRVGYGPVSVEEVASLFNAGFLTGTDHALSIGLVEEHRYLKTQERLLFARAGVTDPLSLTDYEANGGYAGLRHAVKIGADKTLDEVQTSGLRGRGGAAFPAGIKWGTVKGAKADQKYVVCNADEGDSGTFADRMLMEGDPFLLIEGMTIAGLTTGATQGYIYVRSEYPQAIAHLEAAIKTAEAAGYLGNNVMGGGHAFWLQVRKGAGAYICGEETSLLESIEGNRGLVRAKPPLPALQGLFGKPTLVNNVLTLASIPDILAKGGEYYHNFGMGRSRGTMAFQLAGNIRFGGLVEKAFGLTLRELLEGYGGGTASGKPIRAVQVGGPLGAWVPEAHLDTELDYEAMAAKQAMLGHGGCVVVDDSVNLAKLAQFAMHFCAEESCGKCTPCRIGSTRGVEVIQKIRDKQDQAKNVALLEDLCETMLHGSLCAMGGMTPFPVMSALRHFPEDFGLASKEVQS